jgi:MFS family permease
MFITALGVGGIGLATSFEQLFLCRLVTGLGVASLSTAATMTVSDLSTPLNRASTFAPIMSAFAAGTALGPALGGILVDQVGISPTFYLVGASYVGLAAVNNTLLKETKSRPMRFPWQQVTGKPKEQVTVRESFKDALAQWRPLLSNPPIRNVCIMNGFYWVALAGSQITLLPLILTDPDGLAMTATNLGQVYMGMSLVQVFGNPILAKVVDRIGTAPGLIGGCTLISSAMVALPYCTDIYHLAGALGVWATGSSLLSTAPLAFISDKVDDERRAQAIALLRTSGDLGFLIGASSMGALADWTGSLDMAMQSSAGILLTATTWFTARQIISSRIPSTDVRL